MNKKQFALSALAFVVALALVSCEPLRGHAVDIDAGVQAQIDEYLQAYGTSFSDVDFSLDEDEDGNRSVRLRICGLQQALLADNWRTYGGMDFSAAPDTVTFGGYGASGFYRTSITSGLRLCTVFTFPDWSTSNFGELFISADDYSYRFVTDNPSTVECRCYNTYPYEFQAQCRSTNMYPETHVTLQGSGIGSTFTNWMGFANGSGSSMKSIKFYGSDSSSIPVYGSISNPAYFPNPLFGSGVNYTLPTGTVDTSTPWNYYNNVLLPYMRQEFPGYEQYFVFPDGYTPEEPPEPPSTVPTENPTLPGFDFALETNGTEPVTDVNYNIPDMPGKDVSVPVFDFTQINPVEVMAPVADGLRGIWQLISMVLAEYELFPYVALAIFAAIVVMLLHLGK